MISPGWMRIDFKERGELSSRMIMREDGGWYDDMDWFEGTEFIGIDECDGIEWMDGMDTCRRKDSGATPPFEFFEVTAAASVAIWSAWGGRNPALRRRSRRVLLNAESSLSSSVTLASVEVFAGSQSSLSSFSSKVGDNLDKKSEIRDNDSFIPDRSSSRLWSRFDRELESDSESTVSDQAADFVGESTTLMSWMRGMSSLLDNRVSVLSDRGGHAAGLWCAVTEVVTGCSSVSAGDSEGIELLHAATLASLRILFGLSENWRSSGWLLPERMDVNPREGSCGSCSESVAPAAPLFLGFSGGMLKLDDGTDERSQSGWWMVRDCWWRLMNGVVGDRKFSERGKIPCSGAHNSGEETSRSGSLLGVKRQWTVQSPPDCDVSATFMRNRREFDVKLEKKNLSNSMLRSSSYDRCYGDSSYAAVI